MQEVITIVCYPANLGFITYLETSAAAPIPPPPAPYTSSISESSSGDDDDDEDELDSDNVDAMDVDPVQASKPVKKKRDPRTGALIYA